MKNKFSKEKAEEIRKIIEKELELFFKDNVVIFTTNFLKKNNETIEIFHDPETSVVLESDVDKDDDLNYSCWCFTNRTNEISYDRKNLNINLELGNLHGNTNMQKYIRFEIIEQMSNPRDRHLTYYMKVFVEKKPTKLVATAKLKKSIGNVLNLVNKSYLLSADSDYVLVKQFKIYDISKFHVTLPDSALRKQQISYEIYDCYSFETNKKIKFIK